MLTTQRVLLEATTVPGVALVQLDASGHGKEKAPGDKQNYALGITAVLITCVTAGFAGLYILADNFKVVMSV